MIESVINAIRTCLPLRVEDAEWLDPMLNMNGKGWSFNSMSAWRLRDSQRLILGCTDDRAAERLRSLVVGQSIVAVAAQTGALVVDPAFTFTDGIVLEVFSTDTAEPWTLHLPSGHIFVSSPSDVDALR